MTTRTQLKAGKLATNHSEALRVRSTIKAGGHNLNHNEALQVRSTLKAGRLSANHNEALQVRSTLKAGGWLSNHNEALQVRSTLKAGGWLSNHNEALQVRSTLKAGGWSSNHNEALQVRSTLKAGGSTMQHNEALRRVTRSPGLIRARRRAAWVATAVEAPPPAGTTMPATSMASSATGTPIQAFAAFPGGAAPEQLRESATLLSDWRAAVSRALMTHHLVRVASDLGRRVGWTPATLETLGVPADLLACFPNWRQGSREGFVPGSSGLRLTASGAAVPLGTMRLQMAPTAGTVPYTLLLLRALLRTLDPSVRFVVLVEPGAEITALDRLAIRFHPSAPLRVRFVPLHCISVFAQDNARAMQDAGGAPVLFVPRAFRAGGVRAEDELDPAEAQRAFGISVRRSRLYWEGGNIVHDDSRCFVGIDTVSENAARLGLSHDEVIALLSGEFGMPVTPLGRAAVSRFDPLDDRQSISGQASFHIDLDVALLGRYGRAGRPRALVADAARGLEYADDVLRVRRFTEGHFLPSREIRRHLRAEYDASAEARHPQLLEYAGELAGHGYRVVGVPDLRIDPRMDVFRRVSLDFGFCNVLPGSYRGRPGVYHFVSGVKQLDADATQRMRLAGVQPVPVSTAAVASALMQLQGGLHCCCGSLSTDG